MNIKEQVCSLELARKLCEIGIPQETYFWWILDGKTDNGYSLLPETEIFGIPGMERFERISAFTAAELGEILATYCTSHKMDGRQDGCESASECLSLRQLPKPGSTPIAVVCDTSSRLPLHRAVQRTRARS